MNAMTTPEVTPLAAAFARCYQLLGMGFAYPDQDVVDSLVNGEYRGTLVAALRAAAPAALDGLMEQVNSLSLAEDTPKGRLAADYLNSFELDVPRRAVSLYEGSYAEGSDRAQILLEVKSFFQHFGLAVSDSLREPEDHLAAELEFMQFLAAKQAVAEAEGEDAGPYVRAQRDFLDRHLGRWLPAFARAAEALDSGFYRTLAKTAAAVVSAHQALLAKDGVAS